jgi:hypothetical protein
VRGFTASVEVYDLSFAAPCPCSCRKFVEFATTTIGTRIPSYFINFSTSLTLGQKYSKSFKLSSVCAHGAAEAMSDLLDLGISRYPHLVFLPRIWQLRHDLSAYDAAYIRAESD